MTFYEHAMVGICGALATGIHRRHGWQIVAIAGVAAILPDWDGLTILFGSHCFSEGHRLWGHNVLVAGVIAAILSAAAYQFDVLTKIQRWLARHWKVFCVPGEPVETASRRNGELCLWIAVAVVATYSHLAMDILSSGGFGMPAWGVPLLWPFAATTWAYPLLSWGNMGATLIFAAAMFAMLHWKARIQAIALGTLLAVAAYMVLCGMAC